MRYTKILMIIIYYYITYIIITAKKPNYYCLLSLYYMAGTTYTLSFILLKNPENIDSIIILILQ